MKRRLGFGLHFPAPVEMSDDRMAAKPRTLRRQFSAVVQSAIVAVGVIEDFVDGSDMLHRRLSIAALACLMRRTDMPGHDVVLTARGDIPLPPVDD
jgi:hypothetical protein